MNHVRKTLLAIMALAAMAFAPNAARADCQAGDCWGAVAFGPGGAWGYAVNHASRAEASEAAQGQCSGTCTNVLTFHNSCGAYASGAGGYGWGNASTREDAEERALSECGKHGDGCAVKVWGCTQR